MVVGSLKSCYREVIMRKEKFENRKLREYMAELVVIAKIHSEYKEKFGIPRQSGLVKDLEARIIFEPEYRNPDAIRGIEEYSHLWLLWNFSKAKTDGFVPLVNPPRLGGKEKKGVFATRSPFRPNSIGLSSVELLRVEMDEKLGPIIVVGGADLLDETPIYDIKPYLPYADIHMDAKGSFGECHKEDRIPVVFPKELLERLPEYLRAGACQVLEQDPRAAYNKKPDYIYGLTLGDYDIRFQVKDEVLSVCDVVARGEAFRKVK